MTTEPSPADEDAGERARDETPERDTDRALDRYEHLIYGR